MTRYQRINAFYLLSVVFTEQNPFLPVFLEAVSSPGDAQEQKFLTDLLLGSSGQEMARKSPEIILEELAVSELPDLPDLSVLRTMYAETMPDVPQTLASVSVRPIFPDRTPDIAPPLQSRHPDGKQKAGLASPTQNASQPQTPQAQSGSSQTTTALLMPPRPLSLEEVYGLLAEGSGGEGAGLSELEEAGLLFPGPLAGLAPSFPRPAPPPMPFTDSELNWLAPPPSCSAQLLFDVTPVPQATSLGQRRDRSSRRAESKEGEEEQDYSPLIARMQAMPLSMNTQELETLQQLVAASSSAVLSTPDQDSVVALLERDAPQAVFHVPFTPATLAGIVENNPRVAVECLRQALDASQLPPGDASSPFATVFFKAVLEIPPSLHTMEVVNRLAGMAPLPPPFVHLFVANCMASCKNTTDKFAQSRLVRLVCVLIQSLIKNNILDVEEMFMEIQSFCLDFSKAREAISLFKLIKASMGEQTEDA